MARSFMPGFAAEELRMLKHPDLTRRRIESYLANDLYPRLWLQTAPLAAEV